MTYIVCKTMNVPKKPNAAGRNQMMNIAIKAIVTANLATPCSSKARGEFSVLARQANTPPGTTQTIPAKTAANDCPVSQSKPKLATTSVTTSCRITIR